MVVEVFSLDCVSIAFFATIVRILISLFLLFPFSKLEEEHSLEKNNKLIQG